MEYHRPVLVEAVTELLNPGPGLYLDGTLGGGGHSRAILEASQEARVLGVDRDPEAIAQAREHLAEFGDRFRALQCRFDEAVEDSEVRQVGLAGALLDLGVSSHQLDRDERGFTFRPGAPLDMRMGADASESAAAFLAQASLDEITKVLAAGDVRRPGSMARRIVNRRDDNPYLTSDDLIGTLEGHLGRPAKHSEKATLFQALRVYVNGEMEALELALPGFRDALRAGGVLVVISYQSMEDRLVKRAFRDWSDPSAGLPRHLPVRAQDLRVLGDTLTRKPILATDAEAEENPRARPARLRAWRKAAA